MLSFQSKNTFPDTLNWKHIASAMEHDLFMFPMMGTSVESVLSKMPDLDPMDFSPETVGRVIEALHEKRPLGQREKQSIQRLVERTRKYKIEGERAEYPEFEYIDPVARQFEVDSADFPAEWKRLSGAMLFDIFCVKKGHRFTFDDRAGYSHHDFVRDVKAAESATLGAIGASEYVEGDEFRMKSEGIWCAPRWIIDDDVFSTMNWHFAVSEFANDLKGQRNGRRILSVRSFVIPRSTVSLYDEHRAFDLKGFESIDMFLRLNAVRRAASRVVHTDITMSVQEKAQLIERLYQDIRSPGYVLDFVLFSSLAQCHGARKCKDVGEFH